MGVSTLTEVRPAIARDRPLHGFHPLRVRRVVPETSDAVSVVFDIPPDLADAFSYAAGQFLTFKLTIDGRQQLRSYSMSSSPEVDDELQVTVKRVAGGIVSNWIADSLTAGDLLQSTRPAGSFRLDAAAGGDLVAFAGGSGITPVYSLLKTALATTSRRVRLHYANQSREATIFAGELDALSARYGDRLEVSHHFDAISGYPAGDAIRRHAEGTGGTGGTGETAADFYICGPGPYMDLVEKTLHQVGADPARIHIERFIPADGDAAAGPPPVRSPAAAQAPTQVTIELDGKVSTTDHRPGTTILQTARQMGMTPPFSCEAGDCATCMAKLLEGRVQMRANNALLEDEVEEGWILTCQSVPDSPSVHVRYEED